MKTRLILKSGQPGTKSLAKKYGDALLCVRFRYDAKLRQRLKTVELVVERTDWTPPPPRYTADTLVPLRIEAADMPMRALAKGEGISSTGSFCPEKTDINTELRFHNNNLSKVVVEYRRPK